MKGLLTQIIFKFRDPLFGQDRRQVLRLAELIGRLPRPIQFSIETRIELAPPEVLKELRRAGLTSITFGVETPSAETLRQHHRVPIPRDRHHEFIAACRDLGIRTVAGFMIGFPEDTEESIRGVLGYAKSLNPTFANFNVVTPYPGTEFFKLSKDAIADFDFSRYTSFTPVMKYQHLSADDVTRMHHWCARRYYFRWQYVVENAMEVLKGDGVTTPPQPWNGIKFMLALETPDRKLWPQASLETGTFDWRRAVFSVRIPADATVALLHFFYAWNETRISAMYLGVNPDLYTISFGVQNYQANFPPPNALQASAILAMIVPILVLFLVQRFFMRDMVVTGIEK